MVVAASTPRQDPLAAKQQIVSDRMTQLEDRMFRLMERLAETEPEQAKRLEAALREARERLIRRNMEDVIELLEQGVLTEAADQQVAITKNLEQVLKLLLEDPDNTQERKEEMERLEAFRERVAELLEQERELKAQVDAMPSLPRLLAAMSQAVARLEELIAREQQALDATRAAAEAKQAGAADRLSASQGQVREDTESLARDLENVPGRQRPPGEPGEQDSSKPEAGSTNAKPSIEAALGEAREDVERSADEMRAAENDLKQGQLADAPAMQAKAIESLRRALEQLKEQQERAQRQLDAEEAARQQRELEQQARQLAGDMQSQGQRGEGQPGDPSEGQPSGGQQSGEPQDQSQPGQGQESPGQPEQPPPSPEPAAPGTDNVAQAAEHMDQAADELDQQKNPEASEEQQQAIDQLERARDELTQTLDQLRREQQEEILRGLESRFRAMLAQQTLVNQGTQTLDAKGVPAWTHGDELTLAGLVQDEQGLVGQAGEALHILKEEGTTIVFPRMVEQIRADMAQVRLYLAAKQTGAEAQRIEAEIVAALEELIEAIKQLQQELREQASSGGASGMPENPPLLPDSAELKLLRSVQLRVNRDTQAFHERHGESAPAEPEAADTLGRISERQQELSEMARKIDERATGE